MSEANKTPGTGRQRAREVALQVLYAIDLGSVKAMDSMAERGAGVEIDAAGESDPIPAESPEAPLGDAAFDRVAENFDVPPSAVLFARELVKAVVDRAAGLDAIVSEHSRNWRVSRMAAVDRNVLRLAVYELRDTETPVAVVIDQAVDLARRFGSDQSPSFVNGILDAVAREVRAA